MKLTLLFATGLLLMGLAPDAVSQDTDRKSLDITLYIQGFGIVHDAREIEVSEGTSEIRLGGLPRDISPETVYAEFDGRILSQRFSYKESRWPESIYQQMVGQWIRLISDSGDLVEGVLRSQKHGQLWLEDEDGQFVFIPNIQNYRLQTSIDPGMLKEAPELRWMVESETDGLQDVSLYYQVNNIRWSADYLVILDETEEFMNLEARATITNHSGADYNGARVRLVAGDLNVQQQQPTHARSEMAFDQVVVSGYNISPETLLDYHVFELPGRTTFDDQEQKQVTLRRASGIAANKHYLYQTGSLGQVRRNNNRVNVEFRLANTEEYQLGTPLPGGIVKVYQKSGDLMELVGEDRLRHTPEGEDFTISVGRAFDVTVEEKQIRLAELSNRVREEDREIIITNRKDQDITVEVELRLNQNEELRSSSIQPRQVEARRFILDVPVESESETTISLQLRRSN